jgi:mannose-1-phosphate guanylyltransferase/mannose-6-phosphate isomerase
MLLNKGELMLKNTQQETVERPWGSYTVLHQDTGYKIKIIEVNPGAKLSLQMHHKRSEHWVVLSGEAKVTRDGEIICLKPAESIDIPVEAKHRLENTGEIPLSIIEIQNGDYLEEDDIVRFDDVYGRTNS